MDNNNVYSDSYTILKSIPTGRLKKLNSAKLNLEKFDDNSLKGFVFKIVLKFPKEMLELRIDYSLATHN